MKLLVLIQTVLKSALTCEKFLQEHDVIPKSMLCLGRNGEHCCKEMVLHIGTKPDNREFTFWRCTRRACQLQRNVRCSNKFFTFMTSNGVCSSKLSLCQIMLIVFLYLYGNSSLRRLNVLTGHFLATVCDWTKLI